MAIIDFKETFYIMDDIILVCRRSLSSPSVKCPESLATLSAANKHGCMQEISTDTDAMSGANNYGFTSDHYISDGADLY